MFVGPPAVMTLVQNASSYMSCQQVNRVIVVDCLDWTPEFPNPVLVSVKVGSLWNTLSRTFQSEDCMTTVASQTGLENISGQRVGSG